MKRQYDAFTDEELIEQLRDGDSAVMDFLMEKYKYLVRKKANAVFLLGGDTDDLVQEGMIGLFKSVRDFDSKKSSFFHFAELCISRQIYHAIEAAGRKKHVPLNAYVSLSGSDMDSETVPLEDSLNSPQDNPEQMLIDQETVAAFLQDIHETLSPMENKVLDAYLDGWNYRQIARKMGKTEKSIDNALQRIKTKILKLRCHK